MVFTSAGAEFVALRLGSSLPDRYITSIGIGSGSGTASITDLTLIAETDRAVITGSPNFTELRKAQFQGDFNTTQMSGTFLREFGAFTESGASTGSTWQRESIPALEFDGTNELQILTAIEVIPESGV